MLKFKTPLLALSISTALLAPQIGSAAPFTILPLGDSITNGIYNGGNELSYRDDLYESLGAKKYDFVFDGRCPGTGDSSGSCDQASTYKGKVLKHEGRAGWTADQIDDKLEGWLDGWYTPQLALVHIGTNDIFNQDDDAIKTDTLVEEVTYRKTLTEIEGIIAKLKAKDPDMEIYIAKILPIGKIDINPSENDVSAQLFTGVKLANGTTVLDNGDGDAADFLNSLMTPAWASSQGVTVVDMNSTFNFETHFHDGLVHPNQTGESRMASYWKYFIGQESQYTPSTASADKSLITTTTDFVNANNTDVATITLQAKFSSGNDLIAGGDTVVFTIASGSGVLSTPIDNNDGTYTTTVKSADHGVVEISAKINGLTVSTDNVSINFLEEQKILFAPSTVVEFGKDFSVSATSVKLNNESTPTGLKVTLISKNEDVCTATKATGDETTYVITPKNLGVCTLEASQLGDDVYAKAEVVEKNINIIKGIQVITFAQDTPTTAFIGDSFTPKATSSVGSNVTFTATPNNTCILENSGKVTIKGMGTCKVTASSEANLKYKAAELDAEILVSSDKITLPTIADKTVGDKAFTVIAKSSSGAAVTLTASPAGVCSVKGSKVSIGKSAGTCTLAGKTVHGEATTTFTVKKNASQLAIDVVAKVINGSGSITVAQLEPIKGLKNLEKGRDYTKAIKAGVYADKNNPTVAEIQKAVDKANSDANTSGGSTSPLWLLMLGFVALFRRKA